METLGNLRCKVYLSPYCSCSFWLTTLLSYDMTLTLIQAWLMRDFRRSGWGVKAFFVCVFGSWEIWGFPKIRVPFGGVLIMRILLFRVLY